MTKYLIFCNVDGRIGETLQPYPKYSKQAAIDEADALLNNRFVKVNRTRVKQVTDKGLQIVYDSKEGD